MKIALLSDIQKDKKKESALLNLAVRILGLKAKTASEDPNSVLSLTTDSEGTWDFKRFVDKARSKLMLRCLTFENARS